MCPLWYAYVYLNGLYVQKKVLTLILQRCNVFITGQAGTGKTVLLQAILDGRYTPARHGTSSMQ